MSARNIFKAVLAGALTAASMNALNGYQMSQGRLTFNLVAALLLSFLVITDGPTKRVSP